jgi:hypothetical protein
MNSQTSPAEEQLGAAFRDLAAQQPFTPDVSAIRHRLQQDRRRTRMIRGGIGAGVVTVAAVASVGVASVITAAPATTARAAGAHPARAAAPPARAAAHPADARHLMVKLAADLTTAPKPHGDATLVRRQTVNPGYPVNVVWDLYTDDGRYFFSPTEAGMPAQVRENHAQASDQFAREVAAAKDAASGDLDTAALKMAWPYHKPVPGWLSAQVKDMSTGNGLQIDNYVWDGCQEALVSGAGNPHVRAGVLRLVSALPDITVTRGTVKGQPALTITAGSADLAKGIQDETASINARTGIPIEATVVAIHGKTVADVTYAVTRVSLPGLAAGKI